MKNILVAFAIVALSTFAFQAHSASRKISNETKVNTPVLTTATPAFENNSSKNNVYVSTNFIDLSKGFGNVSGDFFLSEKVAASLRFRTTSNREKVKLPNRDEKPELTVERVAYTLGVSYFPQGLNNKFNLVVSPGIAFGIKRHALDVENQVGLNLKATGLIKTTSNFAIEIGLRGDNLEDNSFVGDLYAGLGYLF